MEICIKVDGSASGNDVLNKILQNQILIMSAIDDLKAQVDNLKTQVADLQTSLDNEQAQIQKLLDSNAAVVTDLNTQISTLQAQIAAGATAEQLQDVANSLTQVSDNIATTRADLEGTVPDEGTGTTA